MQAAAPALMPCHFGSRGCKVTGIDFVEEAITRTKHLSQTGSGGSLDVFTR